jgi:glycosyltransferase involved in cell wall biosynthesis
MVDLVEMVEIGEHLGKMVHQVMVLVMVVEVLPVLQFQLLQIIIPCFNEGLAIKDLVAKCNSVSLQVPIKFILVDNGSTDDTWEQLKILTFENTNIVPVKIANNSGYGHGILAGLKTTQAPYVGWIHADLQVSPFELKKFLDYIEMRYLKWTILLNKIC